MIKEKELIYSELSKLYKTYNVEASDDVPANYLVYHLDEMQAYYQRNDYTLTVNCIIKVDEEVQAGQTPPDLDAMVEAVKAAFYFKSFTNNYITYTFYFDSVDEVEEADKLIRRKDVRFTVVGYEERF